MGKAKRSADKQPPKKQKRSKGAQGASKAQKIPVRKKVRKSLKAKRVFSLANVKENLNHYRDRFRKKSFTFWVLVLSSWGFLAFLLASIWVLYDLPNVNKLSQKVRAPSVTFYTYDGQKIATLGDYYERSVAVKSLPKHVTNAFIAVEDRRFYQHFGLDIRGLARAIFNNVLKRRSIQGGSTITQQLAKNFLLTHGIYHYSDRSLRRKLQELVLSLWLEKTFTKEQILSIYLSRMYFGAGAYGLGAAARTYFNREASDLSIKQSAMLAGLLKAPTKYSPFVNYEAAEKRATLVLALMYEGKYISLNPYKNAMAEIIKFNHRLQGDNGQIIGRYFIDWVYDQISIKLGHISEDLRVITTLDSSLQRHAEKQTHDILSEYANKLKISQTAVVIMDTDGAVKAMVGGRDHSKSQFNRAAQARRQLGSVFKLPIFLSALEKGLKLERKVLDGPVRMGSWNPGNYGWRSRGEITVGQAFAYSVNTATVRIARYAGIENIYQTAKRLGIGVSLPQDLTYALGSCDASLLDITGGYAVFANHGYEAKPYGIIKVTRPSGSILYEHHSHHRRVVEKVYVAAMRELLKGVMDYGTGRTVKLNTACYGKSGTSQNYTDAWFVGFSNHYVAGVWMGNDDNIPMFKVTGAKVPGKLWKALLEDLKV